VKKNIEQYNSNQNSEFRDILQYNPNWLIRWGVTIIAIIVAILIFISSYLNEPEVIKSKYILCSEFPHNSYSKDSVLTVKGYKCKMNIEISEKSKIKIGDNIDLELNLNNSGKYYFIKGILDSVKYNPVIEKYDILFSVLSGLTDTLKNELDNKNIFEGNGKIIVENKSLFERIFGKYKAINKL
jgi:hypothetical protein